MVIPRPCNSGRIVAKKWPQQRDDIVVNILKKLQMREVCPKRNRGFNLKYEPHRFRNFRLQEEYDTSDPMLLIPSKVYSISSARGIVFVLLQRGTCYAYRQDSHVKLCILNDSVTSGIQTLFYDKGNDSVLTVSLSSLDSSIECRTTSIKYILRGRPDRGFSILESEQLKWPGYIQFDDVNQKIIASSKQDSIYKVKVFDLKNYAMLYSIRGENLCNIKIGPGILLLRFAKARGYVHLKILSIEDGTEHKSFDLHLDQDKEPKFVELFHEKLLIKQKLKNLQILNIRDSRLTEISRTEYLSPPRVIYLHQNQLFLTMKKNVVVSWDLQGDDLVVTPFGDHLLWGSDSEFDEFYITRDQDVIISVCKADIKYQQRLEGKGSSVNISNILTGHCIAKISATDDSDFDFNNKVNQDSRLRSTVADALEGITAVYFDEEQNQLYTANKYGIVHVWSN